MLYYWGGGIDKGILKPTKTKPFLGLYAEGKLTRTEQTLPAYLV